MAEQLKMRPQAADSSIFWIRNWAGTCQFQASMIGLMHGSPRALTAAKAIMALSNHNSLVWEQRLSSGL